MFAQYIICLNENAFCQGQGIKNTLKYFNVSRMNRFLQFPQTAIS